VVLSNCFTLHDDKNGKVVGWPEPAWLQQFNVGREIILQTANDRFNHGRILW